METTGEAGNRRVAALEVSDGRIRLRLVTGTLAEAEEVTLRVRLNQLQESGRD